ncbi:MAG: sugar transferase [Candidatus Margulisbacteria bacterium]|nr:sugar transferase [Candidatus Margulisiibacteriota bacterium]
MFKRTLDISLALIGLIAFSPLLLVVTFLVWIQDYHSPFYIPPRVGQNNTTFYMVKLRSMVMNADKSGVDSTSSNDQRITAVGRFIRKCKLDEITQLWNVLLGDMSLVGPRPNVKRETDLYTSVEQKLLTVKPGITDFSSIVFSDEGEILKDHLDPDIGYNQLIRPWKSALGIFYIEHQNFILDVQLIFLTVIAIFSRENALLGVTKLLKKYNASQELISVSSRVKALVPSPPPGTTEIITKRA